MKKSVKFISFLIVVFMMVTIAACGKGTTTDSATPKTDATATTVPTNAATVAPDTKQVNMKVLLLTGSDVRNKIAEKYIKVNLPKQFPNIKFEFELGGGGDTYGPKLKTYNATGDLPDVYFSMGGVADPIIKSGNALDLMPYIQKDGFIKKYKSAAAVDVSADGKAYALNAGNDTYFTPRIFYHKDLFEKNGVAIPKTIDEFFATVKTLKAKGLIPIALPGKGGFGGEYLMEALAALDDPQVIKDMIVNKTNYNNPVLIKAADTVQKLVKAGAFPDGAALLDYGPAKDLFVQKKAAMTIFHTWEVADFAKDPDVDFMPWPQVNPKVDPNDFVQTWGNQFSGYAASAKGKNLDLAVQVVEALTMQDALEFNTDEKAPTVLDSGVKLEGQSPLMVKNLAQYDAAQIKVPHLSKVLNSKSAVDIGVASEKLMTGLYSGAQLAKDMEKSWSHNFEN